MFWTNRVEVDVIILQSEHLQILQSHVGGLLHSLQILLTVREQIRDFEVLFQGKREIKTKKCTKQDEGLKKNLPVHQQDIFISCFSGRNRDAAICQSTFDQGFMTYYQTLRHLDLTCRTREKK